MLGEEIIKEILKPLIKKVENVISDKKRKDLLNKRLLQYENKLFEDCSFQKTLLSREESIPIDEFYQPLFLSALKKEVDGSSEKIDTSTIKNLINKSTSINGNNRFFANGQNLVIFGEGGQGKSTLIKHLILSTIKEQFKIPIYIELRHLTETLGDFREYVITKIFQFHISEKEYKRISEIFDIDFLNSRQKPKSKYWEIERLFEEGNDFIFFLDAFDEVPSSLKSRVSDSLNEFITSFSKNNYIITSRNFEPLALFGNFKNYQICKFTDLEVRSFILKQFHAHTNHVALKIIEELDNLHNSAIKEYLNTPLLVSLFIQTYVVHPEIPLNKSDFYYNVFDSLFYKLDRNLKANFVHEKLSKLSKEDFNKILSAFSFITTFENKYEFSERYLNEKIELIKNERLLRFDIDDLITDLTTNICILIKEGNSYKFSHRSLQDYFCANFLKSISEHSSKESVYKDIIAIHVNEYQILIDILLEIDHVDTLGFIILEAISLYISEIENSITAVRKNNIPITYSEIEYQNSKMSYILNQLKNSFELRYIRSNFSNFHLMESEKSYTDLNKNEIIIQSDIQIQTENIEKARFLLSRISSYVESLRHQDKNLINLIRK